MVRILVARERIASLGLHRVEWVSVWICRLGRLLIHVLHNLIETTQHIVGIDWLFLGLSLCLHLLLLIHHHLLLDSLLHGHLHLLLHHIGSLASHHLLLNLLMHSHLHLSSHWIGSLATHHLLLDALLHSHLHLTSHHIGSLAHEHF